MEAGTGQIGNKSDAFLRFFFSLERKMRLITYAREDGGCVCVWGGGGGRGRGLKWGGGLLRIPLITRQVSPLGFGRSLAFGG